MNQNANENNYKAVVSNISNNIQKYQTLLNQYSIDYKEQIKEEIFLKIINKLGKSITFVSFKTNDYFFMYTKEYIVKMFFLYPQLRQIKRNIKKCKELQKLYFQLKAFLKQSKNEKNVTLMKGSNCAFDPIRCLNIDNSCMMIQYTNNNVMNKNTQTLKEFIHSNEVFSQGCMDEQTLKYFAQKLLRILTFGFNSNYLIQGDFSINNLIIYHNKEKNDIEIKLIDYTCSTIIPTSTKIYSKQWLKGHVYELYQSPEFFSKTNYVFRRNAHQCDLFSFGLILFYLATGQDLFKDIQSISSIEDQCKYIKNQINQIDNLLQKHNRSNECIAFIKGLLEYYIMVRSNYYQVREDQWVQSNQKILLFDLSSLSSINQTSLIFSTRKRRRDKDIDDQEIIEELENS